MPTIVRTERYSIRPRYVRGFKILGSSNDEVVNVTTVPTVTNSKSSTEMSGWRTRIRRKLTATTSRSITEYSFRGGYGAGVCNFYQNQSGKKVACYSLMSGQIYWPGSWPTLPSLSAAADNTARMKFYKRAKDAQTAFRSLTFLGELAETLHMLRNPAKSIRKGLDDYVKNVKKRSRRAKKSSLNRIVSETWLEHVFGWQPAISDIRSAGDGLNRRLNRFAGHYTRISGKGEETSVTFDSSYQTRVESYIRLLHKNRYTDYCGVRYYGEVRSVCENPTQADMRLFGMDWRELVPTAWELIPYSFLVDYFSNIGDVLDAWSIRKTDIAWGGKSIKRISERTYAERPFVQRSYTESNVPGFISWIDSICDVSSFRTAITQIDRTGTTPSIPSFSFEIPGVGTKWINMSALLLSRNRTRRQLFS